MSQISSDESGRNHRLRQLVYRQKASHHPAYQARHKETGVRQFSTSSQIISLSWRLCNSGSTHKYCTEGLTCYCCLPKVYIHIFQEWKKVVRWQVTHATYVRQPI